MMRTAILVTVLGTMTAVGQVRPAPPAPVPLRVELDDLDGDVVHRGGAWLLEVEYEVEIKRPTRVIPLVLVVAVHEDGRIVRDLDGRPLEITIPLERPVKQDRREIEYEGSVLVQLDPRSFAEADFDLRGFVVDPVTRHRYASEDGSADYDRPGGWRPTFGVGVGIGPVGVGIGF